ncbi:MAG: hypothetical protein GF398_21090 [Chitinivibrionales bacterium]|nr:hypothetical protein [Chitinivibrionales bacterium]
MNKTDKAKKLNILIILNQERLDDAFLSYLSNADIIIDIARPEQLFFTFYHQELFDYQYGENQLVVKGKEYAVETYEEAKEDFLSWVSKFPNQKVAFGKSLKELFVYENKFSLWWLTGVSQKQFNKTPAGAYFHQMHSLKRIFRERMNEICPPDKEVSIKISADNHSEFNLFKTYLQAQMDKVAEISYLRGDSKSSNGKGLLFAKIFRSVGTIIYTSFNLFLTTKSVRHAHKNNDNAAAIYIYTDFEKDWNAAATKYTSDRYLGDIYNYLKSKGENVAWLPFLNKQKKLNKWSNSNLGTFNLLAMAYSDQIKASFIIAKSLFWWHIVLWRISKLKLKFKMEPLEFALLQICLNDLSRCINGACLPHLFTFEWLARSVPKHAKCIAYRKEFHSIGRIIRAALKNTNVKAIGIQHGLTRHVYYQYLLSKDETGLDCNKNEMNSDFIHYMPVPEHNLLFGQHTKDIFLKDCAYPQERLIITGYTRISAFPEYKNKITHENVERLKATYNVPANEFVLTYCINTNDRNYINSAASLLIEAIQLTQSKPYLIVKPHPNYGGKEYFERFAKEKGFNRYKIAYDSIENCLIVSDILCSLFSNVTYEAFMIGKPAFILGVGYDYTYEPIFRDPAINVVDNSIKGAKIIDAFLLNKEFRQSFENKRENFLDYYFCNLDGKSFERASTILS